MGLKLVIDELRNDAWPDYGIQVAVNRVAWMANLERVVELLGQPEIVEIQAARTAASISLTPEEASAAGGALLMAATRLDHFVGIEGVRSDPIAHALIPFSESDKQMVESVRQHFFPISKDLGWCRAEIARLRLHTHWLVEHQ